MYIIPNYNQELGEKIAYEMALKQLWALEGYVLATRLFEGAGSVGSLASA